MNLKFTLIFLVFSTFLFSQISKEKIYDELMTYGKQEFMTKVSEIGNGKFESKFYGSEQLEYSYTVKDRKLTGPFTHYYKNGSFLLKGSYLNNELHGTLTQFHDNKQIESVRNFDKGKLLPGLKAYYKSGKPLAEETYDSAKKLRIGKEFSEDGKLRSTMKYVLNDENLLSGVEERFYKNGKISTKTTYKNSVIVGTKKEFFENGKLQQITHYNDEGEEHGTTKQFYENGKLQIEEIYVDGEQIGIEKQYFENGNLRQIINFNDDGEYHGKSIEYYENGKVQSEINYKNDERVGVEKRYFENGNLKFSGTNNKLIRTGNSIEYYENGTVKSVNNFDDQGTLFGEQKNYNEEGILTYIAVYDKNSFNSKSFFDDGKLKSTSESLNNKKQRKLTTYYVNGQACQVLVYEGRKLIKNVACYSMDGKKINNGNFANGNGLVKFYNEYGKMYKEAIYKNGRIDDVTNYEVD